jgi:DNA-binding NarL/FixJ family response regulator
MFTGVRTSRFDQLDIGRPGSTLAMLRESVIARSVVGLTRAEQELLTGLLDGKQITTMAQERGRSPRTVALQISGIYRKAGVSSRRELLAELGAAPRP